MPEDELKADIKPTGFFNQKATSIRAACQRIVETYGGEVPRPMEDLLTLRGVARKTANVVLGNAFGVVEGIAVDTHVKRVANRLGFSDEPDPDKIERDLMALAPEGAVVPVHLRPDRPRSGDLRREEAPLRGLSRRGAVSVEPGMTRERMERELAPLRGRGSDRRELGDLASGAARASAGASDLAPLLLVEPAPDPCVLAGHERPLEAVAADRTAAAHRLGAVDLLERGRGGADREEQIGVLADARRRGRATTSRPGRA